MTFAFTAIFLQFSGVRHDSKSHDGKASRSVNASLSRDNAVSEKQNRNYAETDSSRSQTRFGAVHGCQGLD